MNEQAKTYHEIVVIEENLADSSDFIFKRLASYRGEIGARRLKEDGLTLAGLRSFLSAQLKNTVETGGDRLGLPNCTCTNPPSRGFCKYGMCVWGSLNLSKGSGSLSITIPF
mgnify:CR=1 FL=1